MGHGRQMPGQGRRATGSAAAAPAATSARFEQRLRTRHDYVEHAGGLVNSHLVRSQPVLRCWEEGTGWVWERQGLASGQGLCPRWPA
jgi:hypothetical protein